MPPYLTPLHPEISLSVGRRESLNERRDRYRGALKIIIPDVPEELRKRWYGMPPTKLDTKRIGDTLTF